MHSELREYSSEVISNKFAFYTVSCHACVAQGHATQERSCAAGTVLTEGPTCSYTGSPGFNLGLEDRTDVSSYFSSVPLGEFVNSGLKSDSIASSCSRRPQTFSYRVCS
jgi:hypothetical protein